MVYLVVLIWVLGGVVASGYSCWFLLVCCWWLFLGWIAGYWFWCGGLLLCLLDGWAWFRLLFCSLGW